MSSSGIGKKITSGLLWTYLERVLAQGVSTLVTIFLARILTPDHYGVVSVVTIFITICDTLVVGGFSDTLIQKADADELDFSTLFWFVLGLSGGMYVLLFLGAPFVEMFFDTPLVCAALRVMGIRVLINGVRSIQSAYISKHMKYRYFFFATLFGTVLSAIVGIAMAYLNFGVWALVAQYLTNSIVDTVIIWFTCGWRPKKMFSLKRLKVLYSFGWKMQASSLLATLYSELESFSIGKKYTSTDLAFFDKGKQFPKLIMHNVQTSVSKVMLPAFSLVKSDSTKMLDLAKKSVRTSSYVMFPLLIGLMACADEFVVAVLTEKWIAAIPFLRLLSIYYICEPIMSVNKQIVIASGDSKTYLIMEIEKKTIGIFLIILALVLTNSPIFIALCTVITQLIGVVIQTRPVSKIIGYSLRKQFLDVLTPLVLSLLMLIPIFIIKQFSFNIWAKLISEVISGAAIYIVISVISKNKELLSLKRMIKSSFGKISRKKEKSNE